MLKSFHKNTGDLDNDADIKHGAGGLIVDINNNDVLAGRGGRINSHPGNIQFRELVHKHKHQYLSQQTKKLEKVKIANLIVQTIRNMDPPGRFLKEDNTSNCWVEIGDEKARKKAGQAMREKAELTRQELEEENLMASKSYPANHAPMFLSNVSSLSTQGNFLQHNNAKTSFQDDYHNLPIHLQQRYPSHITDSSSNEPFGTPALNSIGYGANGMAYQPNYHNSTQNDSRLTGVNPSFQMQQRYQASICKPYTIGPVPESSDEQIKNYGEFLKGNINRINQSTRMNDDSISGSSFGEVSDMSLFHGYENSNTFSQDQLLSSNQQRKMTNSSSTAPISENLEPCCNLNESLSTQDRRRMFALNQKEQSSGHIPLEKDSDLVATEANTSELMKASIQSFNASGPIRTQSHRNSEDVTMGESSLNRFLEVASDNNSMSLLSFGMLGVPPDQNLQYATDPLYNLNYSNPTTRYYSNDLGPNNKEVNFNPDVNFESKGVIEEASLVSQPRRSSISSWINNDMLTRRFSGTSYPNESMRSVMSDLSENISALDLAHDPRIANRQESL